VRASRCCARRSPRARLTSSPAPPTARSPSGASPIISPLHIGITHRIGIALLCHLGRRGRRGSLSKDLFSSTLTSTFFLESFGLFSLLVVLKLRYGTYLIYFSENPTPLLSFSAHKSAVVALAFSSTSALASSSEDGVKLWDWPKVIATRQQNSGNISFL